MAKSEEERGNGPAELPDMADDDAKAYIALGVTRWRNEYARAKQFDAADCALLAAGLRLDRKRALDLPPAVDVEAQAKRDVEAIATGAPNYTLLPTLPANAEVDNG